MAETNLPVNARKSTFTRYKQIKMVASYEKII